MSHQFISIIGFGNTVNNTTYNHPSPDTKELARELAKEIKSEIYNDNSEYIRSLENTIED